MHIDNKNKDILILDEETGEVLDDATLTTKARYPINFTQPRKRFVSPIHYNGTNNFLFVNVTKIYKLKAKDSEMKSYELRLDNISKDFTINNMKKTGLKKL